MALVAPDGLSHVSLRVTDIVRAIAWWRELFGYAVFLDGHAPTPDRTRHAMGVVGGQGGVALELLESPSAHPPGPDAFGVVGVSLTVPDVAAALAALQEAGHARGSSVIDAPPWRVAFLRDPDGNVVELVQQPRGAADIAALAGRLDPLGGA